MPRVSIGQDDAVAHVAAHDVVEGTLVDLHLGAENLLDVIRFHYHKERDQAQPETTEGTVLFVAARELFNGCEWDITTCYRI